MVRDTTSSTTISVPLKIVEETTPEDDSNNSVLLAITIPVTIFVFCLITLGIVYVFVRKSKKIKEKSEKSSASVEVVSESIKASTRSSDEAESIQQPIVNVYGPPKTGKVFVEKAAEFPEIVPPKKTAPAETRLVPSGHTGSPMDAEKSLLNSSKGIASTEKFERRKIYENIAAFKAGKEGQKKVKSCKALQYEMQRKFLLHKGRDIEDIVKIQAGANSDVNLKDVRPEVLLDKEKLAMGQQERMYKIKLAKVQERKLTPNKNLGGYQKITIKNAQRPTGIIK